MAKGYVLHEGPSPFDGQPIVSIATLHSSNRNTGDMVQTWILPRDLHPLDAVKTHVVNAKDKLGAADRTQLAVMALLYGLIDPLG